MNKKIKHLLFICLAIVFQNSSYAQKYKPFEGTIFYDVFFQATPDSIPYKVNYLTIRAKDSLVRIDTYSDAFGAQTTIRNLNQKKSYILLKNNDTYYAIKQHDNDSSTTNFSFKKLPQKRKLDGFTVKRIKRIHADNTLDTVYYFPKINPIYLNYNSLIKGLYAEYSVQVNETTKLIYRAIKIEQGELDKKLFQIPSIFKIVTLDEFILENK